MQSTSYCVAVRPRRRSRRDALDALAVGVDQVTFGLGCTPAGTRRGSRPLAQLAVPGLQRARAVAGSSTIGVDAGPDLRPSSRRRCPRRPPSIASGCELLRPAAARSGRGSGGRCRSSRPAPGPRPAIAARLVGGEVLQPALLPARRGDRREPLGVGGPVVADVDRRRRALEHVQLAAGARPGAASHCTAVAPVPMMATRLSARLSIGAPVGSPPV